MTERCCETCVHYPPSSFGGKPCSCCNPDDPMTSCWDGRPEVHNASEKDDKSECNGYYILDGELLHGLETIHDLCANYAGCHTGAVEGAFSELEEMLDSLIFDIKQHPGEDVAPVRRGRWEWDKNGLDWELGAWRCSECKVKAETWWANDHKYNPLRCSGGKFCGNCGAKMEVVYEP